MLKNHLRHLSCPSCKDQGGEFETKVSCESETHIVDGQLTCKHCQTVFPIFEEVLELVPPNLQYDSTWEQLKQKYPQEDFGDSSSIAPVKDSTLQENQREHYDHFATDAATTYDEFEEMTFWKAVDESIQEGWSQLQKEGTFMLDVGCGNGRSIDRLMDTELEVIGVDISRAMINKAVLRSKSQKAEARRSFLIADAHNLPFKSQTFDFAMTSGVMSNVPNPKKSLQQIFNVTTQSGVYFGLENNKSIFRGIFEVFMNLFSLWKNEKGAEPELSFRQIQDWISHDQLKLTHRTTVYLPPHFYNPFSLPTAGKLLKWTDGLFKLFGFGNHGGLLVFYVTKNSDGSI